MIPTHLEAVGGRLGALITRHFPGDITEQGAFIGLPLLVIVALFARAELANGPGPLPARLARARGLPLARARS